MNPKGEDISEDLCSHQTLSPSPLCHDRAWSSDESLASQSHYLALNWQAIMAVFWLQCCNLNIFTILGNNPEWLYILWMRPYASIVCGRKNDSIMGSFKTVLRLIFEVVYSRLNGLIRDVFHISTVYLGQWPTHPTTSKTLSKILSQLPIHDWGVNFLVHERGFCFYQLR